MIETVYSNESGEGNLSNRGQASFKMPKNVRQIGNSSPTKKIYVEDYVMTYIKQLVVGDYSKCKTAVLVGQCIKLENCRNIFITGAVEIKDIDTSGEISFNNDTWTGIYEDIKKYFVETEIVGWYIGGPGYLLEEKEKLLKVHVDNFAGQDKTLLTYDNLENEEAFLSYDNNRLNKLEGYYIYYEKNDEMQTYMIDHKSTQSSDASYDDRVSREIRTVLQNKKLPEEANKNVSRLMYAAGTLLAVIVLVVGAAVLNNYDQMKSMQSTLNYLSKNMEDVQEIFAEDYSSSSTMNPQSEDVQVEDTGSPNSTASEEGSLNIEVVPGDVKPLEETDNNGENADSVQTGDTVQKEEAIEEDKEEENTRSDKELAKEEEVKEEEVKEEVVKEEEVKEAVVKEEASSSVEEKSKEDTKVISESVKYYTVESGDTLADISFKLYNTYTKVAKIMELNHIENKDYICVGQKLIVP